MPELEFYTTSKGIQVPSVEGRLFCSGRDPIKEAFAWYALQIPFLKHCDQVVILGLGAGFHLQKVLHSEFRSHHFFVVEKHEKLVEHWKSKNNVRSQVHFLPLESLSSKNVFHEALVLEFRPAWVANEKDYERILQNLKGPSIKEIVKELSLTDQSQQAKIWRALQELVQ